jgi:hypothetical protein
MRAGFWFFLIALLWPLTDAGPAAERGLNAREQDAPAPEACGAGLWNDMDSNLLEGFAERPERGVRIRDARFGGCVTRITDAGGWGNPEGLARHDFSELPAWNVDNSRILLQSCEVIDAVKGAAKETCPGGFRRPRWHPKNPSLIVGIKNDNEVWQWDVATGKQKRLFRAAEQVIDGNRSHQPLSRDGRYLALVACTPSCSAANYRGYAYIADLQSGTVLGAKLAIPYLEATCGHGGSRRPDWAQVTPDSRMLLINWGNVTGEVTTGCGHELFDPETAKPLRNIHRQSQHSSVGVDAQGNEFLFTVDNHDLVQFVAKIPLATGVPEPLLVMSYNGQSQHNSCLAYGKDYCVMSTEFDPGSPEIKGIAKVERVAGTATYYVTRHGFTPGAVVDVRNVRDASFNGKFIVAAAPTPDSFTVEMEGSEASSQGGNARKWRPGDSEIFRVFLDSKPGAPRIERLAHSYSDQKWVSDHCGDRPVSYWVQPHATLSFDGTRIGFASSWGQKCRSEFYEITGFSLTSKPR